MTLKPKPGKSGEIWRNSAEFSGGVRECKKFFDKNPLKTKIKKKFCTDGGPCLGMLRLFSGIIDMLLLNLNPLKNK